IGRGSRGGIHGESTPVMAEQDCLLVTERIDQVEHVLGQRSPIVAAIERNSGRRVAAHVWRDCVVSCGGERGQLMAKRVGGVRKAVHAQHQRPFAHFENVEIDIRRADGPLFELRCHSHLAAAAKSTTARRAMSYAAKPASQAEIAARCSRHRSLRITGWRRWWVRVLIGRWSKGSLHPHPRVTRVAKNLTTIAPHDLSPQRSGRGAIGRALLLRKSLVFRDSDRSLWSRDPVL